MKDIRDFLSGNFQFLEEKFSIYLNRRVFVMLTHCSILPKQSIQEFLMFHLIQISEIIIVDIPLFIN